MQLTVSELFSQYLKVSTLAASSKDIKKRICGYFIRAVDSDIDVRAVDYGIAEDFKNWLISNVGRAVNSYLRNFKPFWIWLVRRRFIRVNPFELIKDVAIEDYEGENFTADEIQHLMMVADLQWQVFVVMGMMGLRRGESLNLKREDIDFDKQLVHIRGKKKTESTWSWEIKNHHKRITTLPENIELPDMVIPVHKLIRQLMLELPEAQPYILVRPKDYATLIKLNLEDKLSDDKKKCPYGNFSRDFRRLQKRANVKPIRGYRDLRATFGTEMCQKLGIKAAQELLGHKTSQTTMRHYNRLNKREIVKSANQIVSSKFAV